MFKFFRGDIFVFRVFVFLIRFFFEYGVFIVGVQSEKSRVFLFSILIVIGSGILGIQYFELLRLVSFSYIWKVKLVLFFCILIDFFFYQGLDFFSSWRKRSWRGRGERRSRRKYVGSVAGVVGVIFDYQVEGVSVFEGGFRGAVEAFGFFF